MSTDNEQAEVVWGVACDRHAEDGWQGAHKTREAAEAEAKERVESGEWEEGWICQGNMAQPEAFMPDAEYIVEQLMSNAADNGCPDFVDDPFDVSNEAGEELDQFLKAWAKKHLKANWWEMVPGTQELVAKREST